jgi:hypothetical protein
MIGGRDGLPLDLDRVFAAAAERGVAMEINSQPERSDLSDAHARLAREKGVRLVVDTDAHSTVQLDYIRFGVFAARRAGLGRGDVLNTLPYLLFREATAGARRRAGRAAGAGRTAAVPEPAAEVHEPAGTSGPAGRGTTRRGAAPEGARPAKRTARKPAAAPGEPPAPDPPPGPAGRGKPIRRPR